MLRPCNVQEAGSQRLPFYESIGSPPRSRSVMRAAIVLLVLLFHSYSANAQDQPTTAVIQLLPFDQSESHQRLLRSKHTADFFVLANQFEPQMNIGTCGPTTAVIVLNSLRRPDDGRRPIDATAIPEVMRKGLPQGMQPVKPRYTQRAFFDERFAKVKTVERFYGKPDAKGTRDPGLQLRQLHKMLKLHGVESKLQIVDQTTTDDQVRKELVANLARAGDFVVINYHRKSLGQPGGGHISPVAAYDEQSDSFLVMDVNPNKAPWVWVSATDLIAAMRTKDTAENRGYLLLREGSSR